MAIFFQQDIDESTRLAIWKIEERESFFLSKVPLQREITHPHKRLQHLAGRYLLKYLFVDFPLELIRIADTRKPYLEDEAYHFSISHCSDFAAVIASKDKRVGVDIEMVSEKIGRIRHKFVSDEEEGVVHGPWSMVDSQSTSQPFHLSTTQLTLSSTLIWSCKEAAFKWYGWGGVDFREHMKIKRIIPATGNQFETIMSFEKKEALFLNMHTRFFDGLCMSYVIT
jgi:phosphopantetheinyl transferase